MEAAHFPFGLKPTLSGVPGRPGGCRLWKRFAPPVWSPPCSGHAADGRVGGGDASATPLDRRGSAAVPGRGAGDSLRVRRRGRIAAWQLTWRSSLLRPVRRHLRCRSLAARWTCPTPRTCPAFLTPFSAPSALSAVKKVFLRNEPKSGNRRPGLCPVSGKGGTAMLARRSSAALIGQHSAPSRRRRHQTIAALALWTLAPRKGDAPASRLSPTLSQPQAGRRTPLVQSLTPLTVSFRGRLGPAEESRSCDRRRRCGGHSSGALRFLWRRRDGQEHGRCPSAWWWCIVAWRRGCIESSYGCENAVPV